MQRGSSPASLAYLAGARQGPSPAVPCGPARPCSPALRSAPWSSPARFRPASFYLASPHPGFPLPVSSCARSATGTLRRQRLQRTALRLRIRCIGRPASIAILLSPPRSSLSVAPREPFARQDPVSSSAILPWPIERLRPPHLPQDLSLRGTSVVRFPTIRPPAPTRQFLLLSSEAPSRTSCTHLRMLQERHGVAHACFASATVRHRHDHAM
mmetsp:Transcript_6731/g.41130  ORF Transcript_6731/g.41130 Transcript_6731/m.41130 type:complete len:212 (-) Transcript_6731:2-637(-)